FSSRRRHTRFSRDWSSDVCSSDLAVAGTAGCLGQDATRPIPPPATMDKTSSAIRAGQGRGEPDGPDPAAGAWRLSTAPSPHGARSEERRVGKEGRPSRTPEQKEQE